MKQLFRAGPAKKLFPFMPQMDTSSTSSIRTAGTDVEGRASGFGEVPGKDDLLWAVQNEPVSHFLVHLMSRDVFDNWFTVDDSKTEGPDPALDEKVQILLTKVKAKQAFLKTLEYDRLYGKALLVGGFNDAQSEEDLAMPLSANAELLELGVFHKYGIVREERNEDPDSEAYGETLRYELDRGKGHRFTVHTTRCYLLSKLGYSVLQPVWGDLTSLRNVRWSLGQTMYRVGSGFAVIKIPTAASPEQLKKWAESGNFTDIMHRTFILLGKDMEFKFEGAAQAVVDPQPFYQGTLEAISIGSGVPEPILRGAQAGALTGSEVNERKYFKLISSIQSDCDEMVRWVCDKLVAGLARARTDYTINWVSGYETSPLEQAQESLTNEQANAIKLKYMTVDEVRARAADDLEPLPNGEGAKISKPDNPFGGPSGAQGTSVPGVNPETGQPETQTGLATEDWLVRRFVREDRHEPAPSP